MSDADVVAVSAAQEGLVRVFDRMLEVGPLELVRCRLLVDHGLVGAVMGEGGKRINKVIKETGCFINVCGSKNLLPQCARSSDELVQISGGSLAVKKALVVVSRYIQQKTLHLIEGTNVATVARQPSMNLGTDDTEKIDGVNEQAVTEVIFKLLCPYNAVGAVLGFRGRKVKALEEETEAFILISAPEHSCTERVITISAFENRESHHSSAQNALVRVFNELTTSGGMENVTARLLIHPSQFDCLKDSRDSIISNISKATGATMQILEQSYAHTGALIDEKVMQIDGEYSSVQIALFQVSWMLRESTFGMMLANNNSPLLPHKLFNRPPYLNRTAMLTEKMKLCKVSEEINGWAPPKAQHIEFRSGDCLSTRTHPTDSTTVKGGPEHSSNSKSVIVTNAKMEIAVRAHLFSSVFGDDGSNLSRLRTISGATVEVQDHCPGNDGKVIISGTPDQTVAAQSLLQAFLMAAQ